MFVLRGVRARQRRPGVRGAARARGARWPARRRRSRSLALVRRNRRRYGGYIVHVGMAVLFVGVAASSAFQHARDVALQPGPDGARRRLHGHATTGRRRAIDVGATAARALDLGADARRRQGRQARRDAAHRARLLPDRRRRRRRASARYFDGEATSEVGLKAGLARDIWTAVAPDLDHAAADHRRRATRSPRRQGKPAAGAGAALLGQALAGLVDRYERSRRRRSSASSSRRWSTWIWIGGLIVFARRR